MLEFIKTEKFDIGAGFGELEYDFFVVNSQNDFWTLVNYYVDNYKHFDYYLHGYETIENNTNLSPIVQSKMKGNNANLCLTCLEKEFKTNNMSARKMYVNKQIANGMFVTYIFFFFHFANEEARNYLGQGF